MIDNYEKFFNLLINEIIKLLILDFNLLSKNEWVLTRVFLEDFILLLPLKINYNNQEESLINLMYLNNLLLENTSGSNESLLTNIVNNSYNGDFSKKFINDNKLDSQEEFTRLFQKHNEVSILTKLNNWQYWWWFWFAFLWAYYDVFFKKIAVQKNIRVYLSIYSSVRPHGKFGDFIACTIPICWVINIVFNSNSLLKLIEWQNDRTLLNIRVRARQWYWLYHYDFKHMFDLFLLPKQIGWKNWRCDGFGVYKNYSSFLMAMEGRTKDFSESFDYWDTKVVDLIKERYKKENKNVLYVSNKSSFNEFKQSLLESTEHNNENYEYKKCNRVKLSKEKSLYNYKFLKNRKKVKKLLKKEKINKKKDYIIYTKFKKKELLDRLRLYRINYTSLLDLSLKTDYIKTIKEKKANKEDYDLNSDNIIKKGSIFENKKSNKSLFKISINLSDNKLNFSTNISTNNTNSLNYYEDRGFTSLKQERLIIKKVKTVPLKKNRYYNDRDINLISSLEKSRYLSMKYDDVELNTVRKNIISNTCTDTLKDYVLDNNKDSFRGYYEKNDYFKFYRNVVNKNKSKMFSRRLLTVKKTLILPTLTPINILTNSYDVVHSWFIPALGVKFDCVPGKSTHNLLYIEHEGMFYGQCAEICGRYHHHMPIRLYGTSLTNFITWWSHIGFFKAINLNKYKESNRSINYGKPIYYENDSNNKDILLYPTNGYIW